MFTERVPDVPHGPREGPGAEVHEGVPVRRAVRAALQRAPDGHRGGLHTTLENRRKTRELSKNLNFLFRTFVIDPVCICDTLCSCFLLDFSFNLMLHVYRCICHVEYRFFIYYVMQ